MSDAIVSLAYSSLSPDAVRALVSERGYVYVPGIPDGFDHAAFCAQLGLLMPQYNGDFICSITPDERFEHLDHPLTRNPLPPHTDGYEFDYVPPKYLVLWCVTPPADGGGRTTLGDMLAFTDTLSADDRRHLTTQAYRFVSGIEETPTAHASTHTILHERPGEPAIFRFSHEFTEPKGDPFLVRFTDQVLRYFDQTCAAIAYEPNALLVWDNFRMAHGRTGFDDPNRHLMRVWLGED